MLRIVKKFGRLFNYSQKKTIIIIVGMMIIGALLELLGVGLMLPLVTVLMKPDIITTNKYLFHICSFFKIDTSREFIIVCFCVLIFVFIIKNIYLILEYRYQYRFIFNNRFSMQKKILDIYLKRPYEFFLNAETGEILRVINGDVGNSYNLLITMLSIATEIVVSTILVITVFVLNPFITIATALSLLLVLLVIARYFKPRLHQAGMERENTTRTTNKWLLQSINGIKEIKISQTEFFFKKNYNQNGKKLVDAERKNAIYGVIPRMLIEMISISTVLLVVLIIVLGGANIMELAPILSAFAMAAVKLLPSVNRIAAGVNQIAFQEPALDNLLQDLQDLENYSQKGNTIIKNDIQYNIKKPSHEIELKNITYYYPNTDKAILKNANMKIPIGKSIGIVGPSGAGKTTAVDIILGLLSPQKGQVLCDGIDIKQDYYGWLSHIGYIPQMIFMLDDTIRANVTFGQKADDENDAKVWKAIKEAQLEKYVRSLPKGLDTTIGERGIRISGGQRQRIGIARALYTNPEILIFDEATSALDNETEAAIMQSINALRGHKTLIIIAHRLTTIEGCDLVYRVQDGKIVSEQINLEKS